MSNITMFQDMSDDYKELLAQLEPETNIVATQSSINRLSIRGGVFRKVVNGQEIGELEDRFLNVVIVKSAPVSRTYYADAYVAGQTVAPTCWSADTSVGRPSEDVPSENLQSGTCFDCPQNIKGSGMGESRACRFQQRIALLLADQDGTVRSNEIYQLTLPATSVFGDDKQKMGLQTYAKLLNTQKAPLASVLTELRFDTASSTPKLVFKPIRPLEKEELGMAIDSQKNPDTIRLITLSVKPKDDTPQITAQPKAEPSEEKIEEPKVKVSKKKAQPEVKPDTDLASLLDEFDD